MAVPIRKSSPHIFPVLIAMANWSDQSGYFPHNVPSASAGDEEKEERIVRRSEVIAMERNVPFRRSSAGNTGKPVIVQDKVKRKRRPPKVPWKKPPDMPKRPLSAYNLFFAHERERLIAEAAAGMNDAPRGSVASALNDDSDRERDSTPKARRIHAKSSGIGFANLAKTIGNNWRSLEPGTRAIFERQAVGEKERYTKEISRWRAKQPKGKPGNEDLDKKLKATPTAPRRRQSSPPDHRAEPAPDTAPRSAGRRASEPLPGAAVSFAFEHATSPGGSDSSSWIEPMDGGSLASLDDDWEDSLDGEESQREWPTPRRTYSDSMLQIRPDFYDVRPCEELVAENVSGREGQTFREETKDCASESALRDLKESLDDDLIGFITTLGKTNDE